MSFDEQILSLVLGVAALIVLLLLLYGLHKIRRVHLMLFAIDSGITRRMDSLYTQLEALAALQLDLRFEKSLPPMRGWAASPDFLRELSKHALACSPSVIVECSSGVSTLILASCAQLNNRGHVYSLEHDPVYAAQTRKELDRHGLSQWATVLDAPIRSYESNAGSLLWYDTTGLAQLTEIDMLVIDGPPAETSELARYPAGPLLFKLLAPGSTIFLDDADRSPETETVKRWCTENERLRLERLPCEKGCVRLNHDVYQSITLAKSGAR